MFLRALGKLGTLVWKQTREIEVLNYPRHIVYQIYTNQGYLYFIQDKDTQKISVENSCAAVDGDKGVPHLR